MGTPLIIQYFRKRGRKMDKKQNVFAATRLDLISNPVHGKPMELAAYLVTTARLARTPRQPCQQILHPGTAPRAILKRMKSG